MQKRYPLLLVIFLSTHLYALPPPAPSAGVIERQIEQEYEAEPLEPTKEIPSIKIDIPEERLQMGSRKKVFVQNIKIEDNESISSKEICSWIEDYTHRELSLQEIYDLCHLIEQNYAKKGYFLARAYPPPQDILDETLLISIIEGKLGNVRVEGNNYYKTSFIESYFSSLQNRVMQYDKFLHALMLLNDNSDLLAGAVFTKGQEFGYADVIIRVQDSRPVHLYLNGNNYGRNLTTNVRAGGRLDWGNLITQGDKFSVAEVIGFPVNALYFTDATYTIPLNRKGTSLEAAYLFSKFKIEELTSLHLKGRSDIATLKVNQAFLRNRAWSIDLFSYFDYKQIQNYVLSRRVSFDKLRVLTVGALFDHFTPSMGRDYLTLEFAGGIPDFLGGLKAVDSQSCRRGGGGRFFILNANYDRIQLLPNDFYLYLHASGQLSPNKLTLPEQIYIGGMDTVRGFPLAVALGDSGYYANVELRIPPPFLANKRFFKSNKKWKEILQFDAFIDNGGVFLHSEQNTFLWGSGAGLRVNGPYSLTFSLDVGFPLNHRNLTRGVFTYMKLTGKAF